MSYFYRIFTADGETASGGVLTDGEQIAFFGDQDLSHLAPLEIAYLKSGLKNKSPYMVLTALSSGQISLTDTAALAAKMSYEEAREYVKTEILSLSSQDNQISTVN